MLFAQIAGNGTRFAPRIRGKGELHIAVFGYWRQLEKIPDENHLQSAERFLRHQRLVAERAQYTIDAIQRRRIEH